MIYPRQSPNFHPVPQAFPKGLPSFAACHKAYPPLLPVTRLALLRCLSPVTWLINFSCSLTDLWLPFTLMPSYFPKVTQTECCGMACPGAICHRTQLNSRGRASQNYSSYHLLIRGVRHRRFSTLKCHSNNRRLSCYSSGNTETS